ncbi:uncharacterized protein LOC130590807 [Beta vulgaris subsp. vulgaris]|uniref:uncharacterized protein LOC130590807 n=1 Tax=Beta vulgaris subsp. vulgaris TaxID=3555 RepID=UPI00254789D1|nr:uncharacterized protein LOC130590807 [Beta vulgaris subsp. vulgaris]
MNSVGFWNIRGLNILTKHGDVRTLLSHHKCGLFGLLETRVKPKNVDKVYPRVCPNWSIVANYSYHKGGRIWLIWLHNKFEVEILESRAQYIHSKVTHKGKNVSFYLTMVYCSNDLDERLVMWEDLKRLKIRNDPWVICGDFNNVVNFNERVGSNVTFHEVEGIRRCIWKCEVQDMGAKAYFLPESISDHTPCIIQFEENQVGGSKVFRFFNMWTQAAEFEAIVMRGWQKQYNGGAMFKVVKRMKGLKRDLKELNKQKFSNIENEADLAYKDLISIQQQMHSDLRNQELQASEREARRKYEALNQARLAFLQQKVKCEWLKGGDSNTAYFHACLRRRRGQNHIYKVKDSRGVWAENQEDIEKAFMEFYKDLLGNEMANRRKVSSSVLNEGEKLNIRQQEELCQPFCREEVKKALDEIEDNKAPGPDGYSSHFFKKAWEVIGEDVTEAVLDFFRTGKILKQINNTTLCLIPKCDQPQDVTQFRPIACCNVLTKSFQK